MNQAGSEGGSPNIRNEAKHNKNIIKISKLDRGKEQLQRPKEILKTAEIGDESTAHNNPKFEEVKKIPNSLILTSPSARMKDPGKKFSNVACQGNRMKPITIQASVCTSRTTDKNSGENRRLKSRNKLFKTLKKLNLPKFPAIRSPEPTPRPTLLPYKTKAPYLPSPHRTPKSPPPVHPFLSHRHPLSCPIPSEPLIPSYHLRS